MVVAFVALFTLALFQSASSYPSRGRRPGEAVNASEGAPREVNQSLVSIASNGLVRSERHQGVLAPEYGGDQLPYAVPAATAPVTATAAPVMTGATLPAATSAPLVWGTTPPITAGAAVPYTVGGAAVPYTGGAVAGATPGVTTAPPAAVVTTVPAATTAAGDTADADATTPPPAAEDTTDASDSDTTDTTDTTPPPAADGAETTDAAGADGDSDSDDSGLCLAGDSLISVLDRGAPSFRPLMALQHGDAVLAGYDVNGAPRYEEHLGFLHALPARRGHAGFAAVTIAHSGGTSFKASPGHLVLVQTDTALTSKMAADLAPGEVIVADGGAVQVVTVQQATVSTGMFAPLTRSGTIVVNGVLVSNYAQPAAPMALNHAAAHAALFLLRAYHGLGLRQAIPTPAHDPMHPFAATLLSALKVATSTLF